VVTEAKDGLSLTAIVNLSLEASGVKTIFFPFAIVIVSVVVSAANVVPSTVTLLKAF
jgi:hypothetical protein